MQGRSGFLSKIGQVVELDARGASPGVLHQYPGIELACSSAFCPVPGGLRLDADRVSCGFTAGKRPSGKTFYGEYFTAGLGGYGDAFHIDEYKPGVGWISIKTTGRKENLLPNKWYEVELKAVSSSLVCSAFAEHERGAAIKTAPRAWIFLFLQSEYAPPVSVPSPRP